MQQWHLTLERQTGSGFFASAAHIGSNGIHLLDQRQANQPLPGSPAPFSIWADPNDCSRWRKQLQLAPAPGGAQTGGTIKLPGGIHLVEIDRRYFEFVRISRGSGFPTESYNLRAERGLSDFNLGQRFVLCGIYPTPERVTNSISSVGRVANAIF